MNKKAYIGIDPGKSGAIVVQEDGMEPIFYKCPMIGDVIDLLELDNIFKVFKNKYAEDLRCVLEDVHSIFGTSAGSNFSFGFNCGVVEMALVSNRISYTKVQPKAWQKVCFQGIPEMREPSKTVKDSKGVEKVKQGKLMTKEMSILAAKRLYPEFSLLPTARSKKPDSNISDALLMMHYCKTQL